MHPNKKHDKFFQKLIEDLPCNAKVLLVYFAIPDEEVKLKHGIYKDYFNRNGNGKQIELKVASYNDFIKEVRWADEVYFRGGDTFRLLGVIDQYPGFMKEIKKKKIVAG